MEGMLGGVPPALDSGTQFILKIKTAIPTLFHIELNGVEYGGLEGLNDLFAQLPTLMEPNIVKPADLDLMQAFRSFAKSDAAQSFDTFMEGRDDNNPIMKTPTAKKRKATVQGGPISAKKTDAKIYVTAIYAQKAMALFGR